MTILQVLMSLLKIFIIIIPGYVFSKKNTISEKQCSGISSIVVNLTWPCLIIDSLQIAYSKELLVNAGYVVGAMAVMLAVSGLAGAGLGKVAKINKEKALMVIFMLLFANTGFMGIPVANTLYGSEGVFYAALYDSLSDIFVFTVGLAILRRAGGQEIKSDPRELITPGTVCVIAGVILFVLNVELPDFLGDSISMIGGATTPLSMFIIGYRMGKISLHDMFGDRDAYIMSAARLALLPVIAAGGVMLLFGDISTFVKIIVLETAMPAATCTVILAGEYGGDVDFATKGVLMSTLLSIVTIPVFAVFMEII